jgi:asparagine synthase (glutamine-hydrolysing)
VKTFTVGFDQAEYDEAPFARDVARHLGADHTELYVTGDEALDVIPRLPHLYDEPFSDSSQIPTFLISRLTRRHVTVSLSGDGGDELFGGYNRYFEAPRLWNACRRWPAPFRRGVRRAMYSVPISAWDRGFRWARPLLPARLQDRHIGDTVYTVADVFGSASQGEIYRQLISHFDHPDRAAPGAVEPPTALTRPEDAARGLDPVRTMMYQDLISYHPDDILVKVDRASMGVGLEARVPLIDHRVVELAARLPLGFLIQGGQGKQPLRRVLDRHVPRRLIERPKKGFGVPLHLWLRGPLRPWAEDLLAPGRLDREGFFDTNLVRRMWNDHLSGRRDWKYHLWDFLMFQAWLDTL